MKKYLYALLISVLILPACQSDKTTVSDESVMSMKPDNTATNEPAVSTPTPTPTSAAIPTTTPAIIAKEIPAGYKKIEAPRVILKSELPATYKELIHHPLGMNKGEIVFYEDKEDMISYAYRSAKAFYPIGDIGAVHYRDDISVEETKVFGKNLLRVKGVCGASCMITDYLQIEQGGVSSLLLIGGDAAHIDLDQDGELEILVRHSATIAEISIVKMVGQQLMEVNVNETLKAEKGIGYDDEKQLFTFGAGDQMESYRLDSRSVFIQVPTP